jgi:hypothetical protein
VTEEPVEINFSLREVEDCNEHCAECGGRGCRIVRRFDYWLVVIRLADLARWHIPPRGMRDPRIPPGVAWRGQIRESVFLPTETVQYDMGDAF